MSGPSILPLDSSGEKIVVHGDRQEIEKGLVLRRSGDEFFLENVGGATHVVTINGREMIDFDYLENGDVIRIGADAWLFLEHLAACWVPDTNRLLTQIERRGRLGIADTESISRSHGPVSGREGGRWRGTPLRWRRVCLWGVAWLWCVAMVGLYLSSASSDSTAGILEPSQARPSPVTKQALEHSSWLDPLDNSSGLRADNQPTEAKVSSPSIPRRLAKSKRSPKSMTRDVKRTTPIKHVTTSSSRKPTRATLSKVEELRLMARYDPSEARVQLVSWLKKRRHHRADKAVLEEVMKEIGP